LRDLLRLKRVHDAEHRLESDWYRHIAALLAD
jgi:hypothetical protein